MRQSEIGLEVFGPRLAGAKTTGKLQVDFSGGFTNTSDGVNLGLVRLRVANLRMDWKNTSVIAGQDEAFMSPLSPTSFASLAIPAFGYAGNLWGWIPQVRVEHRFNISEGQDITLQAGLMDNVTGELPSASFERPAQAGESSGQPAYAARIAWKRRVFGMPLVLGTAGYYSRQNWLLTNRVDGWAGMTDWSIPLTHWVTLTGEFYRGRALGGLGGGVGRSVLFTGDPNPIRSVAASELGGRMVSAEDQSNQQTGVQRGVWRGQSICFRFARIPIEPELFSCGLAAKPQRTGKFYLPAAFRSAFFR